MAGTVKRTSSARIVITLEVEVPPSTLAREPGWRRHVTDYLRGFTESAESPQKLIALLRRSKSLTITDEKIEVCP